MGRDAKTLLGMIGVTVPDNIRCITFEGPKEHPLIATELMMPILGVVRAKDFDDAVEQAVWLEHGNRHSAHIHSKNVDNITKYAKAIDTAILVKTVRLMRRSVSEEKGSVHLRSPAGQARDLQAPALLQREDAA